MLHVHRADRADDLVAMLADLLAVPGSEDAFMPEVVAVPSRGIERWLAQELATRLGAAPGARDGICANVVFPFPSTVVGWVVDGGLDGPVDVHERGAVEDPWQPRRLVWTLLDVVDGVPDLGAFGAHLAGPRGRQRRLPALRHVADLFDRYAVHRPDMVRAWAAGDDVDGLGGPLADTARWQPALWRAARAVAGPSFAERVATATARLPMPVPGLPRRLCLYGLTALPATHVEVLESLAGAHDVHLFLLHPSPGLWDRLTPTVAGLAGRPARGADETVPAPRHPLVRSWARDAREMQVVLAGRGATASVPGDRAAGTTLLARLQADVRADRDLEGDTPPLSLSPSDDSVQVHACHGRLRQVEVLRDAVLGLLADDPTLEPRDIVVMCPDVEAFAPLVDAVFDADVRAQGGPDARLPDLRVRLADRALREVNPLLRTVADLLQVPDGRLEATTVLDLAHRGPVRSRFRFGDRDLDTLEAWVADLHVRWGLDAEHRRAHGLHTDANTWARALDRLLLGAAVAEEGPRRSLGGVPFDDVEGDGMALAGRVAEFLHRLGHLRTRLAEPRPVAAWADDLRDVVALLTATGADEDWQAVQLDRLLDDLVTDAGGADGVAEPVTLPELRALLDDALRGRPSRANHRSGDLTVCTLVPMRSVPYRVVCLLGLDDETFPRRTVPSGDDLLARAPVVGDRDPRTEDRQLLLDAVLAARDHLVVTYRARDERTNAEVPPAVPVAELLDVVDQTAVSADGSGRARDLVLRAHPLRAADPRNFRPDAPFGFDPVALAGARARLGERRPALAFLDRLPAPAPAPTVVAWSDLVGFLAKPLRTWLRTALGVSPTKDEDPTDDLLPLDADGLQRWAVGTNLLRGALDGTLHSEVAAARGRGELPVGQVGEGLLAEVIGEVRALAEVVRRHDPDLRVGGGTTVPVDLEVGGVHLVGALEGVRDDGLVTVDYGKLKAKRLLRLWLPWLVLQATGRGRPALLVARAEQGDGAAMARLPANLDAGLARERLAVLLDLQRRGLAAPLPLFEGASSAFARALADTGDRDRAVKAAAREWFASDWQTGRTWGDGLDAATLLVYGERRLDDLLALSPATDEDGSGWATDEPSRFGRLARRLWDPVLADVTIEVLS